MERLGYCRKSDTDCPHSMVVSASKGLLFTSHRSRCHGCSRRTSEMIPTWRIWTARRAASVVLLMVLYLSSAVSATSCQRRELIEGYVPSDMNRVNDYRPRNSVHTMEDCVTACCDTTGCDLAWMVEGSCYSVGCRSPASCKTHESVNYRDSQLAFIRDLACVPGYEDCELHEVCEEDPLDFEEGYSCQCATGYSRDSEGNCEKTPVMTTTATYDICHEDEDCEADEYCFGLHYFQDGICAPAKRLKQKRQDSLKDAGKILGLNDTTATTPDHVTVATSTLAVAKEKTPQPATSAATIAVPEKKDGDSSSNGTDLTGGAGGAGNTSDGKKNGPSPSASRAPPQGSTPSLHEPTTAAAASLAPPTNPSTMPPAPTTSPTSTTVASAKTLPFVQLVVSLGDSRTLQLPDENKVRLIAFVIPEEPPDEVPYTYAYRVVSEPEGSAVQMASSGQDDPKMQFSNFKAGFYQFKVEVTGSRSYGTAKVNMTVVPPPRINQPPVAVIQPSTQVVTLPNSDTILDGSGSTDDDNDRIASYRWEQFKGPIGDHEIQGDQDTLQLTDLKPGVYLIRLTVTDYDGASNSTIANVTVKEEEDYKPHANAGPDVEIKLPVNFATLNGSKSSDDHEITGFEWTKMSGQVADMTGTSSKILHLTQLEEGTYVFKLTVSDRSNQKDEDTVTVIVKPEQNDPPVADAGPDKELSLPTESTELDGRGSSDDLAIASYHWEQVSGPTDAVLDNPDKERVTVSKLAAGTYVFRLTVTDGQGETASDEVSVSVKVVKNQAPVAVAGEDQEVILPSAGLELDGSLSYDDREIVSYQWIRTKDSPAGGVVVGSSDHEAILRMVDLVPGKYKFVLNVTDANSAYSTDTVTVHVREDPNILSLVQLIFDVDIKSFTRQDQEDLMLPLAVMLGVNDNDILFRRISHTDSNRLKVIFLAQNKTSHLPLPGVEVIRRLKSKGIAAQKTLLNYPVLEYDTVVCQNNCSGHGTCDQYTKRCVCETFWMENFFRVKLGDGEHNCDWSILYVIIVCFLSLVAIGVFIWLIACCCSRRKKRGRRRHRYTLLEEQDDAEHMEMLPKMGNGKQSSSIMISESGEESDDETTVFDIKRQERNGNKPANGFISNKHRNSRTPHRTDKL
ncbi:dyslexia-associated protein KIAA0319-like protein [Diadema antillarum]|uniref:dyslexia-associated protein KIAA0319-like protein n=1 Tax=Diadema antillarum TaxID=105358 RepID=UPI003A8B79FE